MEISPDTSGLSSFEESDVFALGVGFLSIETGSLSSFGALRVLLVLLCKL